MNWLDELEDKVKAASEEIRRLRDENRDLAEKIAALEPDAKTGGADWGDERKAIRKRVEKIVKGLEKIVEG
jgi:predicted  nucleic acid-binding Zn-ribbon protein